VLESGLGFIFAGLGRACSGLVRSLHNILVVLVFSEKAGMILYAVFTLSHTHFKDIIQ